MSWENIFDQIWDNVVNLIWDNFVCEIWDNVDDQIWDNVYEIWDNVDEIQENVQDSGHLGSQTEDLPVRFSLLALSPLSSPTWIGCCLRHCCHGRCCSKKSADAFIYSSPSLVDQLESHHAMSPFYVYPVFACLARPCVIFQSCFQS